MATGKKCKICKKKLVSWNKNDYCFAHLYIGLDKEYHDDMENKHRLARLARKY